MKFLLMRLVGFAATLSAVYLFSFLLMRAAPGGPFSSEKKIPDVIKRNIEERYKLDQPLWVQIGHDFWRRLQFDFGHSYRIEDYTVNEIIAEGFPVSASLGILALVFALTLGISAGVISAVRRRSVLDVSLMLAATLGIAVPSFVLASLAVLAFVFYFKWFPAAGWGSVQQLVLPALCLGAPYAAYIARLTRTGMLEVLSHDYVRTAHAKGLPEWRVITRHVLRGALLPVVSYLGPAVAGILTGSLVVESIFYIPGLGTHFVQSALQRDYTLSLGLVLLYTCLLYGMNTLVDLAYALLDPRVKLE